MGIDRFPLVSDRTGFLHQIRVRVIGDGRTIVGDVSIKPSMPTSTTATRDGATNKESTATSTSASSHASESAGGSPGACSPELF